MEKNDKEKQMLYEWGKANGASYHFPQIDKAEKSYYIRRETEDSYIREYGFETLPELVKELDTMWGNEEAMQSIKKVVGVAAIKNKPVEVIQKSIEKDKKDEREDRLPAFIYNF